MNKSCVSTMLLTTPWQGGSNGEGVAVNWKDSNIKEGGRGGC